jgi:chloramphenicol 3-O phosphotransferase
VESRPGRIILLNSASSAGKSTIAWELQRLRPQPHLFAGIDSFTPMLRPDGHIGMDFSQRTNDNAGDPDAPMRWIYPDVAGAPVRIEFAEAGHRLVRGMHRALAALARAGNDVIFEHVLLYDEWADDLLGALDGLEVYLVAVRCPIDAIEERERARSNRVVGQARSHHEAVHRRMAYDIEIDTSLLSPREAAAEIAARVKAGPAGAFAELRARRR